MSCSIVWRRAMSRSRVTRARQPVTTRSRRFENQGYRRRQAFPLALLLRELPPAKTRQRVVFRPLAAVGYAPLRAQQSLLFEFVQCRVQRAAADGEHVAGAG